MYKIKQKIKESFAPESDPLQRALAALIPTEIDRTVPLFPDALAWIQNNQNKDGTWVQQGADYSVVDTLISTLGGVVALGTWENSNDHSYSHQINKGSKAVERICSSLGQEFEVTSQNLFDLFQKVKELRFEIDIPIKINPVETAKAKINFNSTVLSTSCVEELERSKKWTRGTLEWLNRLRMGNWNTTNSFDRLKRIVYLLKLYVNAGLPLSAVQFRDIIQELKELFDIHRNELDENVELDARAIIILNSSKNLTSKTLPDFKKIAKILNSLQTSTLIAVYELCGLYKGQAEAENLFKKCKRILVQSTASLSSFTTPDLVSAIHAFSNSMESSLADVCLEALIERQNADGGWGTSNTSSSVVHTSLAIIAVLKQRYYQMKHQDILELAQTFFQSVSSEDSNCHEFIAAEYALQHLSERLIVCKACPECVQLGIKDPVRSLNCEGMLLCTLPEFKMSTIAEQLERVGTQVGSFAVRIGVSPSAKIWKKYNYLEGGMYVYRHSITDTQLYILGLYCTALERVDDVLDASWQKFKPEILQNITIIFVNILQGKIRIDEFEASEYETYSTFTPICNLLQEIRDKLKIEVGDDLSEFEITAEEDFMYVLRDVLTRVNGKNPVEPIDFINVTKDTVPLGSLFTLGCYFRRVPTLRTFKTRLSETEYKMLEEYKDYAFRSGRLGLDIPSFLHDIDEKLTGENFVVVHRDKYGCTLEESFHSCLDLHNDEILNMLKLKEKILTVVKPQQRDFVESILNRMNCCSEGSKDWAMRCGKYATGAEVTMKRRPFTLN